MSRLWFEQKPMQYRFMRLVKVPCGEPRLYLRGGCLWCAGLLEIKKARDWLNKVIAALEYPKQQQEGG